MNTRAVSIIVLTLFFGTFFGTLLGEILGWILPESVVRDFFLKSINFTLGGYRGEPLSLDLIMFSIQFGLKVTFNFTMIVVFAASYYFLRYFR